MKRFKYHGIKFYAVGEVDEVLRVLNNLIVQQNLDNIRLAEEAQESQEQLKSVLQSLSNFTKTAYSETFIDRIGHSFTKIAEYYSKRNKKR